MNKYTVTFFTNGYGQQPADLADISVLPELPILEEDGFTFEGWFLDEDLTIPAEVGMEVTSDLTLYASWSRNRVGWGSSSTEGEAPEPSTYAVIGPGLIDPGEGGITSYYRVIYDNMGYGTKPATVTDTTTIPDPLPVLSDPRRKFEGWYTINLNGVLKVPATPGLTLLKSITLYAKWVPWPYAIQKGALPTWHDLYVKDSTDEVNLDDIAVSITESDISTYGYNSSSNYYQTTSWLCTDDNLVGSNVPKVPNYLVGNTRGLVCKGCELNVSEGSHSHYARLVSDGTLTRTSGGKLTYSKTDGTEMVIFEKDAPYLFYFELVGAGGGGGSSTGNIVSRYDGSGGGSGSVIAGILNFTKYSSYQFTIGKGGSGGVKNSDGAAATNGTASRLTVNAYTITVPGGSYGQNGGSTAGAGGTASTFYMVDSSGTPLSTLTLQSTRYYPEMGVWILVTQTGNAGGQSVKDGGGDGANPPYFSNTSTIFGTRSIGLCNCYQYGSGGEAGKNVFGDDIYSNGSAGTLGGGGGGGIYANAGNHNGGAGGSGVLYLIY